MQINLSMQVKYLENLLNHNVHIAIYLINGIKLSGFIESFDDSAIILSDNKHTISQLIYKHAISTIVPINKNYNITHESD